MIVNKFLNFFLHFEEIFIDHSKKILYIMGKVGDKMNENFGTVLKELRKKKNLTAKAVSNKLQDMGYSISDKTISGYETGIRMPNADIFMALCQIYECKNILEKFSFVKAEYSVPTDDEWKIIEKYRFISEYSADCASMVDYALDKGYSIAEHIQEQQGRIEELENKLSEKGSDAFLLNTAHADDYMGPPEELRKLEEDIMDDEDF